MHHIALQLLLVLALASTQDADLVVLKNPMNQITLPPIVIDKIATGEQIITPGKKFSAPHDWLRDLKVTVRNQSDRTILYVVVSLRFPAFREGETITTVRVLSQGKNYLISTNPEHGEDLNLKPGEPTELSLPEERYQAIMREYEGFPRIALSGIEIAPHIAVLDVDHAWFRASYVKRESINTSFKWIVQEGRTIY